MSRWRPPTPKGSPYITQHGWNNLQAELKHLWQVERPQVTQVVHEAAKNGDRSENGDYIYGKRRLREIDSRLGYLRRRLDVLKVVDQIPRDQNKIFFGAFVTLEKEDGSEVEYRLVGPDEFDLREFKLSMDSPLAKALFGKTVDDEIVLSLPEGKQIYYVVAIRYAAPAAE